VNVHVALGVTEVGISQIQKGTGGNNGLVDSPITGNQDLDLTTDVTTAIFANVQDTCRDCRGKYPSLGTMRLDNLNGLPTAF
jgi:hypothetical protein